MPNRIIKETICTSDDIDSLSWFEEVVWYRLIVNCDDFGRFDGRPAIIKSRLFPLKGETVSADDISKAISRLAGLGMISMYSYEGKPFLHLPSWTKHQSQRAAKSKYPDPADGTPTDISESTCEHMHANEIICEQVQANVPDIRYSYSIFDIRYSDNNMSFADAVLQRWNSTGATNITKISAGSQRAKHLTARVNEHGEDAVLKAIDNIKQSSFLKGDNSEGWTISFDWFVKPSNFVKVLEGNYTDKKLRQNIKQIGKAGATMDPDSVRRQFEMLQKEEALA